MKTISLRKFRGRWGNQIIEYAFIRSYARRHGLRHEVCPWAGRRIFGFDDPLVSSSLPDRMERYVVAGDDQTPPLPPLGNELSDCNFLGWAQYETSYYAPDRTFIQGLYSNLVGAFRHRLDSPLAKFLSLPGAKIGLHIRRGDFGRMCFFLTPVSWYIRWLEDNLRRFDNPVVFIASEDIGLVPKFAHYRPVVATDFGLKWSREIPAHYEPLTRDVALANPRGIDFLPDWWFLKHCDVVLTPNSTYSFTAAWLNPHLLECWRSRLTTQRFERIDPWNCEMQWKETVDDHPGIPGTSLDHNPEWDGGPLPKHKAVAE